MTWTLKDAVVAQNPKQTQFFSISLVMSNVDDNGMEVDTRTYTEPNCTSAEDEYIARLAADWIGQFNKIDRDKDRKVDLDAVRALVVARLAPPVVPNPPTKEQLQAQLLNEQRQRAQALQHLSDSGLLPDDRLPELDALRETIKASDIDAILPQITVTPDAIDAAVSSVDSTVVIKR